MENVKKIKSSGEKIGELLFFKILTESDWEVFKKRFENIYPEFLIILRNYCTKLTAAEQRLFLLIKLKFNTREISNVLGISGESVRKSKYRLKKKLNLNKENSLEEFIYRFN